MSDLALTASFEYYVMGLLSSSIFLPAENSSVIMLFLCVLVKAFCYNHVQSFVACIFSGYAKWFVSEKEPVPIFWPVLLWVT